MSTGQIFISYRREDSGGYTRAIYDQLVQRFSKERVFMDVDAIEPGLAFDEVIDQAVGHCEVLLVMTGKRWMEPEGTAGSRLNDPKDFVRVEIVAALSRNIRVIPILLDGAIMPSATALPETLRALTKRNAIDISNSRFDTDVERLVAAVGKALGQSDATRLHRLVSGRRSLIYWIFGALGGGAIVQLSRFVGMWPRDGTPQSDLGQADWRFCGKCQSMFYNGYDSKGVCPAGGAHSAIGNNFVLPHDVLTNLAWAAMPILIGGSATNVRGCSSTARPARVCVRLAVHTPVPASTSFCLMTLEVPDSRTGDIARSANAFSSMVTQPRGRAQPEARTLRPGITSSCLTSSVRRCHVSWRGRRDVAHPGIAGSPLVTIGPKERRRAGGSVPVPLTWSPAS